MFRCFVADYQISTLTMINLIFFIQIQYEDVCHNDKTVDILNGLVENGFLLCLTNSLRNNDVNVQEILKLLPAKQLQSLAKRFQLKVHKIAFNFRLVLVTDLLNFSHFKAKNKKDIIPDLLNLCKKQSCIISGSMEQKLRKEASKIVDLHYKLSPKPRRAFNR